MLSLTGGSEWRLLLLPGTQDLDDSVQRARREDRKKEKSASRSNNTTDVRARVIIVYKSERRQSLLDWDCFSMFAACCYCVVFYTYTYVKRAKFA